MPRGSAATKATIIREAERLFARYGVYQVTVREILEAAGQRNVSAINYHFGSREGVLDAILVQHGDPTDLARGELLATLGPNAATRDLVTALVVPYAAHLASRDGRDYLRIVAQLSGSFDTWRTPNPGTGPWLRRILDILEGRPRDVAAVLRRERVVQLIMLMTAAMAQRARLIETGRAPELDEATFTANLTDVLVGVLEAPLHGPLRAGGRYRVEAVGHGRETGAPS